MLTWEQSYDAFERAQPRLAVVPIGALEQHSTHLPIGTDFILVQEVARRVAEQLEAWLLPALPYSNSQEHHEFHGTVWLRPTTLAAVVEDLVLSLRHQGIRYVVLLSGHGGNWILKPTVRQLNLTYPDVKVLFSSAAAVPAGAGPVEEMHAGASETSRLLAIAPHLVKDHRTDYVPAEGREFIDYVGMRAVTPSGVWGRPTRATREDGERLLAESVQRTVAYVRATIERLEAMRR